MAQLDEITKTILEQKEALKQAKEALKLAKEEKKARLLAEKENLADVIYNEKRKKLIEKHNIVLAKIAEKHEAELEKITKPFVQNGVVHPSLTSTNYKMWVIFSDLCTIAGACLTEEEICFAPALQPFLVKVVHNQYRKWKKFYGII